MKKTNKTTPPTANDTPTEPKTVTPDTEPPSDLSNIDAETPKATTKITEVSKPVVEIIACFANCAGFPDDFLDKEDGFYDSARIEYVFDLKDNRTGRIYKSLFAYRVDTDWFVACLYDSNSGSGLPMLRELEVKLPSPREYYADIKGYEDIIRAELNRWSRNLFAMADSERDLDEGFDDYVTTLTELVEEYKTVSERTEFDDNGTDWRTKFDSFPLRP